MNEQEFGTNEKENRRLMLYKDIEKEFTEIVADYLSKGYIVDTKVFPGQVEQEDRPILACIDVKNGKEKVRIILQREGKQNPGDCCPCGSNWCAVIGLKQVHIPLGCDDYNTNLSEIEVRQYYEIAKKWYASDEEILSIVEKKKARYKDARVRYHADKLKAGCITYLDLEKAAKIVLPYIRKEKGWQRTRLDEITAVYAEVETYPVVRRRYTIIADETHFFLG